MKVLMFGASGMIGQAVLRECLLDERVESILSINRSPLDVDPNDKLREIVLPDVSNLLPLERELQDYDACYFCLGVSARGMSEDAYRKITYGLTLDIAHILAPQNPEMTFVYVSGVGTDSSSRMMWARVKGETEEALSKIPFKGVYLFRPGVIQPMHGIKSRTAFSRNAYSAIGWLIPAVKACAPNHVITSEEIGRAMINVTIYGSPVSVMEVKDIVFAAKVDVNKSVSKTLKKLSTKNSKKSHEAGVCCK